MSIGLAVLLGLVQGLTEFLPVSSSGHLALVQMALGQDVEANFMLFDVLLHFGTLIAVVIAFWKDVRELIVEFFRWVKDGFKIKNQPYRRFIIMLLITIVPMFAVLPFKSRISQVFESSLAVGIFLLVTAALLMVSEKFQKGRKTEKDATWLDALVVGIMQCFALLPGVSRSGTTMVGGLMRGFSRDFAVRFAFIMSLPVVLGANILEISEAISQPSAAAIPIYIYIIGIAVSLVSGLFAIRLVKLITRRGNFRPFVVYCTAIGVVTIVLSLVTG